MKPYLLLLGCALLCIQGVSQNDAGGLHWYLYESLIPLDHAQGKELVTDIRELTDDSLSSFNPKSQWIQLATKSELDEESLVESLNNLGYYLISVRTTTETQFVERASKGVQFALMYLHHPALFQTNAMGQLTLHADDAIYFTDAEWTILKSTPQFIVKEG